MKFYDAHNHLQDERFAGRPAELVAECAQAGVARMVVNGACEGDWPEVLALAKALKIDAPALMGLRIAHAPWDKIRELAK